MTALQIIIKEAKSIKAKYPKRFAKWTDYVKQASAIYSSKHKGKSSIVKKKVVKKAAKKELTAFDVLKFREKVGEKKFKSLTPAQRVKGAAKKVGAVKRKVLVSPLKKKAVKKAVKKPIKLHKDTKSHNVNIRVISGIEHKKKAIDTLMLMEKDLQNNIDYLNFLKNNPIVKSSNSIKTGFKNITQKKWFIKHLSSELKARKKGVLEQYKLIKLIK